MTFIFSSVDHNTDYDDLNVLDQDEEEKYFDSEEADVVKANNLMEEQTQTKTMCFEDS